MTVVTSQLESSTRPVGQRAFQAGGESRLRLSEPSSATIGELVRLFKLLADETRMRILSFLQQTDELNVGQFCQLLGQRQPSVSHHLAMLRHAGLINMRRDGKHNYYLLAPAAFEQLITMYLGSSPGQPARICFDGFELRYAPTAPAAE
jgi:ArsR family transcriptional regulator